LRPPAKLQRKQVFLSYSGREAFEASLLQYALEQALADVHARVWTYERDQAKDERAIAQSLKQRVQESKATVFLLSTATLDAGATQWMELAYSDAFRVPTFVLLHGLSFADLRKRESGVPPLLLAGECTAAVEWKSVLSQVRKCLVKPGKQLPRNG
jgi:hypothetical protein